MSSVDLDKYISPTLMREIEIEIDANESYLKRFVRRQKRFVRFLGQYPSEVIWGPYFTVMQRSWRMIHGWK